MEVFSPTSEQAVLGVIIWLHLQNVNFVIGLAFMDFQFIQMV